MRYSELKKTVDSDYASGRQKRRARKELAKIREAQSRGILADAAKEGLHGAMALLDRIENDDKLRSPTTTVLIKGLEDTNPAIMSQAAQMLVEMNVKEAVPSLVEVIWTARTYESIWLIGPLVRMKDERCAPLLRGMLADERMPYTHNRILAGRGLRALGLPAPGLEELIRDREERLGVALPGPDEPLQDALAFRPFPSPLKYMVTAGAAPYVSASRTDLGADMKARDDVGFEFGIGIPFGFGQSHMDDLHLLVEFGLSRLTDSAKGLEAMLSRLDLAGGALFFSDKYSLQGGLSIMHLDFDDDSRDMLGAGIFFRAGLVFPLFRKRGGLQLYADIHGWLGGDDHGFQAAGSRSAGVKVVLFF